jgi:asparagine synthetase B (glutamine-hydrolysing)
VDGLLERKWTTVERELIGVLFSMCGIHLHLSRRLVQVHQHDDDIGGGDIIQHHPAENHVKVVVDGMNGNNYGINYYCNEEEEEDEKDCVVDGGEKEEEKKKKEAAEFYPSWLCRRGPDHQGRFVVHKQQIVKQMLLCKSITNTNGTTTTTTTTTKPAAATTAADDEIVMVVDVKLALQASVLSMRECLVRQPVVVLPRPLPPAAVPKATANVELQQNNNSSPDNHNNNAIIYFCWNGEVYQEKRRQQQHQQYHDVWRFQESDTNLVAQRLQEALLLEEDSRLLLAAEQVHDTTTDGMLDTPGDDDSLLQQQCQQQPQDDDAMFQAVHKTMSSLINAEFAYCITTSSCIYYGKDRWGCRSLLTGRKCSSSRSSQNDDGDDDDDATTASSSSITPSSTTTDWYLSSVTTTNDETASNHTSRTAIEWTEVPPGIVFEYNFMTNQTRSLPLLLPTQSFEGKELMETTITSSTALEDKTRPVSSDGVIAIHPNDDDGESNDEDLLAPSRQLYALLRQAVRRRFTGPCTILFSGGLDSVVLAALALERQQELQQEQEEEEEHAAQEQQPRQALHHQQQQHGCRDYSIVLVNISFLDDNDDDNENGNSGSKTQTPTATRLPAVAAADTRAALASYHELQRLYPKAKFEFIQRQVTYKQVAEQEDHIRKLIYPKQSTMDLNIATALWFAAQWTSSSSSSLEHRILLTGLGADELMGGYGRHRKAYQRGGLSALRDELRMDQERLWERNLGRDDRVLSDHGKEARFPYLDGDVVQFLTSLASSSSSSLCDFSLPPGQGDKRILRLVARHFLQLDAASSAVKRAIQFGSRISHVCDKRRFGK